MLNVSEVACRDAEQLFEGGQFIDVRDSLTGQDARELAFIDAESFGQLPLCDFVLGAVDPDFNAEGTLLRHTRSLDASKDTCQQESCDYAKVFFGRIGPPVKQSASDLLRQNIKARVANRGGQAALARAMKVSESTVSTWLSGRNDIELSRLGDIATFFGVAVSELFLENDQSRDLPGHTRTGASVSDPPDDGTTPETRALDEGPMREALRSVREAIGESMARVIDAETRLSSTREATRGKAGRQRVRGRR